MIRVDLCSCICGKDLSLLCVLHVCGSVTVVCDWRRVGLLERAQWEGHVSTGQMELDRRGNRIA